MSDPTKVFVYPKDVPAFAFDWGKLSLTVAPEVNGAARFSGGVVDLPPVSYTHLDVYKRQR